MAGKRHGLSDRAVKAKKKPGRYPDGGSLYFHITERGNRSWEYNFRIHRKRRAMGLGPYPTVSLKEARELRDDARKLVRAGTDPIIARGARSPLRRCRFGRHARATSPHSVLSGRPSVTLIRSISACAITSIRLSAT